MISDVPILLFAHKPNYFWIRRIELNDITLCIFTVARKLYLHSHKKQIDSIEVIERNFSQIFQM